MLYSFSSTPIAFTHFKSPGILFLVPVSSAIIEPDSLTFFAISFAMLTSLVLRFTL